MDLDSAETLAGMWLPPVEETEPQWYDEPMQWADEAGIMHDGRPEDYVKRDESAVMFQRYDKRVDEKIDRRVEEKVKEYIFRYLPEDDKQYSGLLN